MLDLSEQTYGQMADILRAIREEVCKRVDMTQNTRKNVVAWRKEINQPILTLDILED